MVRENFKLVHNSGTIKLIVEDKEVRSFKYSGVVVRQKKMEQWNKILVRLSRHFEGYILLIPDWHLWNGKILGQRRYIKPKADHLKPLFSKEGRKVPVRKTGS